MSCLIYPNFLCDIPKPLRDALYENGSTNRSLLEYAVSEYQDKKMGVGEHFIIHYKNGNVVETPLAFWIRKLIWKDQEVIITVEADIRNQDELIENAYIEKDLNFFLRGRILKYKDTGEIKVIQLSHIEPVYKSKPVASSAVLQDTNFVSPFILDIDKYPKSASYIMPTIMDYSKIAETGSYGFSSVLNNQICSNTIDYRNVVNNIDVSELYKIFQDLIDRRGPGLPGEKLINPVDKMFKP